MNFYKFIAVVVYTKRSFFHLDDFFYCLATLTFQLGLTNASSVDQKRPCSERTTSFGTPTHSSNLRESFLGKTHLLILFSIYSLFQLQLQYTIYNVQYTCNYTLDIFYNSLGLRNSSCELLRSETSLRSTASAGR